MNQSSLIRCGVAGVGYLGQHHARIYNQLGGCELAGIYDTDTKRASEVAGQYGGEVFSSLTDLAKACDVVSVVVPTPLHCEVALPLLEAGCHLLIEKPLCVSLEEAEKILEAANQHGCLVQVGHIEHFNPVTDYLEEALKNPRFITVDRLAPFNPRGTEVGVVLDLMIHDIGLLLQLVRSPVERVESVGVKVMSAHEDIANTRLVFANGCVANLNASRVSLKKVREIRVFQPGGYLSLDFMNQKGHLIKMEGPMGMAKESIPIEKGEPLMLELAAFVDCVKKAVEPKVDGQLGKSALELAIRITEQIQAGQVQADSLA